MALWSHKKEFIFKAVDEMYTDVASHPDTVFHFPTGRSACLFVGYPANHLNGLRPRPLNRSRVWAIRSRRTSSAQAIQCSTSAAVPEPTR